MVPSEDVLLRAYLIEIAIPQAERKIIQLIEKDAPLFPDWYPEHKVFLCPRCKHLVSVKDRYCRYCGGRMKWYF